MTPRISDADRRRRLLVRHALTAGSSASSPEEATEAVVVLHSTEPATVYLSVQARVPAATVADVDRALYQHRTLVKQLAMRRTLFVFPRDLLPAAWGSASARVAEAERRRMAKEVVAAGLADDGDAWVARCRDQVLAAVAEAPEGLTALELRERVPEVAVQLTVQGGAVWNHSRVLTLLGLTADLVRGANTQHWRVSRPRWTPMAAWLGQEPGPLAESEGYTALVARWLARFGPGTEDDLVWWLGGTKAAVRTALAAVDALPVTLDDDRPAWVLPGDAVTDDDPGPGPHAALLPVLDPTTMGWKERGFYLGGLGPRLFDRNGNAGTTAWVDGRAVGCWVQDDAGRVHVAVEDGVTVKAAARRALESEAEQLTSWLDGTRVGTVYPSPAMKDARERAGDRSP